MRCPVDNIDLIMTDRQGVEIDYCPQCRGVWLDRGELDKIIERSLTGDRGGYWPEQIPGRGNRGNEHGSDRGRGDGHGGGHGGHRVGQGNRRGWLGDLFG